MFEVIIERPRRRRGRRRCWPKKGREFERMRHDPDGQRAKESMRFWTGRPFLNENLAPLARFLRSRVGRPWNAVHAEICAQIAPASAVQKHVLDHLADFVAIRTYAVDGDVYGIGRHGGPAPVGVPGCREDFYVCPRTGRLLATPRVRRPRHHWPLADDVRQLDPLRELRCEKGVWYLVRYAWAPRDEAAPLDERLRARLGATLFEQLRASREASHRRRRPQRVEVSRTRVPGDHDGVRWRRQGNGAQAVPSALP